LKENGFHYEEGKRIIKTHEVKDTRSWATYMGQVCLTN
jgi:hypothetical protein